MHHAYGHGSLLMNALESLPASGFLRPHTAGAQATVLDLLAVLEGRVDADTWQRLQAAVQAHVRSAVPSISPALQVCAHTRQA